MTSIKSSIACSPLFSILFAGLLCIGTTTDAAQSRMDIVGAPSKGFKVTGMDIKGADVAALVSTDLTQASCYDKAGGFQLVETDPDKLAAIKAEIDLSNSRDADPETRLRNRYVPPSKFVGGSWTSDGTNLTITLQLADAQGKVLLTRNGSGPVKDFFNLSEKVTKDLTNAMCGGNWKCKCNGQMYKTASDCAASCPRASLRCMAPTCLEMDPKTGKWTRRGI
jgi:hypothetical protein